MKKLIVIIVLISFVSITANGQKLDAAKVPAAVKTSFASKYNGITAKWEKEDGKYEASFVLDGKKMSAMFLPNGNFTESEIDITESELPAAAPAYLKSHYNSIPIKGFSKITKANGSINYEVSVNKKDALFDADGKFLKEVKD